MVPETGFEPATFGLQNRYSTIELLRQYYCIYNSPIDCKNWDSVITFVPNLWARTAFVLFISELSGTTRKFVLLVTDS